MGKSMISLDKFIKDKSDAGENVSNVNDKLNEVKLEKDEATGPSCAEIKQEDKAVDLPSDKVKQEKEPNFPDAEAKQEGAIEDSKETQNSSDDSKTGQTLGDSINKWAKETITEDTAIGAGLALYSIVRVLIKAPVESYESLILTLYNTKQRREVIPNWIGLTLAVLLLLVLKRLVLGEDITIWTIAVLISTTVIVLMFGNIKPIKMKKE